MNQFDVESDVRSGERQGPRSVELDADRDGIRDSVGRGARYRVCFVGGATYDRPLSGAARAKFKALSDVFDIHVVGFSSVLRPRLFKEHAQLYLLPRLPIPILRYLEFYLLVPPLLFWIVVRQGIDVIVSQSPYEALSGAFVKAILRRLGRRVGLVVESHGDFEHAVFLYRRVRLHSIYESIGRAVASISLRSADALRAISRATREQLLSWAPDKDVHVFPAWTDIEQFLAAASGPRNRDSQDVLFVGGLAPIKGVENLVDAFEVVAKRFPAARLRIVGPAQNLPYANRLHQRVQELGLLSRVDFMGAMEQRELAALMTTCAVLVLPSYSEGLGRVVLEAMAAGLPVIASRVGGIPDLIDEGVTGLLVSPGDQVAIANNVCRLLEHPDRARMMGQGGHRRALNLFSSAAYVESYRNLVNAAFAVRG